MTSLGSSVEHTAYSGGAGQPLTIPLPKAGRWAVIAVLCAVTFAAAAGTERKCRRGCRSSARTCRLEATRESRQAMRACPTTGISVKTCRRAARYGGRFARAACRAFSSECRSCCQDRGSNCTARCADDVIDADRGEECDPPGSIASCSTGPCGDDCRCPPPPSAVCADAVRELSSTCNDSSVSSDDDCTIAADEITDVVAYLADDAQEGRDNLSPASTRVRQYLIERLQAFAVGGVPGGGFEQSFAGGTNLLARIPAADPMVSEAIVLGAHYDHLGLDGTAVYNGATDNAAGVAVVLAVGRELANLPTPPARPIILALWDAEEDGLLGSTAYTISPAVPLADTVAYVNVDIAGSSPVVGWRRETFVIGRDTSDVFPALLAGVGGDPLTLGALGAIFGQGRSDYVPFLGARVPILFFSDATGGCYHTLADDLGTVHVGKVVRTAWLVFRLVRALADAPVRPAFRDQNPPLTFDDAVTLRATFERGLCDATASGVQATQQADIADWIKQLDAIVARGPAAFNDVDLGTVGQIAVNAVPLLRSLPCQRN